MSNEAQPHAVLPEDLTLYALGALDGPELVRVGKHVEGCAACRLELQKINADLGAYAVAAAPNAAPPSRAKDRLMAQIAHDGQPTDLRVGVKWSFAFRAVVALLLLVAALVEWREARSLRNQNQRLKQQLAKEQAESAQARAIAETIMAPDAMRLALVAENSPTLPTAHVICSRDKASVFLTANHLAPLGPGKTYELWMLTESGAPVPAGMFQSDAAWNAQMLHKGLPSGMEPKGFAITIEPEEGSLSPTTKPILMATAS